MHRQKLFFTFTIGLLAAFANSNANAQMKYTSSEFVNRVITENSDTKYSVTTDITQNGIKVGQLDASLTYGTGTNPFEDAVWTTGQNFSATGMSTSSDTENDETAAGIWDFSVTAEAGYRVDGLSLFSLNTILADPIFSNITSNGVATVWDGNQNKANELLGNHESGDIVANGSDLVFNNGSGSNGIAPGDHSELWSYDTNGTEISFEYQAGPVEAITAEGIRFDASFSAIPEPSTLGVLAFLGSAIALRRRRK